MVLEKKNFFKFFPIMSMELQANDPQVVVNFGSHGLGWQDLFIGPLDIAIF